MNKTELIDFIAEKAELTKVSATRTLEAILEAMTDALKQGDPVILFNFGTFTVKMRAAREGRNPKTGEKIRINATKSVGFKPSKILKEAVKEAVAESA